TWPGNGTGVLWAKLSAASSAAAASCWRERSREISNVWTDQLTAGCPSRWVSPRISNRSGERCTRMMRHGRRIERTGGYQVEPLTDIYADLGGLVRIRTEAGTPPVP